MSKENSRFAVVSGLALAGAGVAHFANPELFERISKPAFPNPTRELIYTNGGIETALGLGLVSRRTRRLATVGLIGYLAYLGGNAARNSG
jgi:uncharacterized membrane protein